MTDIPQFPESRPIELLDKALLEAVFWTLQPRISEFTFANIYLFRSAHAYRLSMVGDALVLLGRGYSGGEFFMPPLSGDVRAALYRLLNEGMTLSAADGEFIAAHFPTMSGIIISEDRDNFDYLYRREELAELSGNRYHKKKNRINYFVSRHDYRIEPYGLEHLDASLHLLEEWRRVHSGIASPSLVQEAEAVAEALQEADSLGLQGLVALVDGIVRGFTLGEKLNSSTVVCHFEKTDPFMEGLSQLLNREFNRLLYTDCTWINREQDLGEPGLRAAKLSYHPVELMKKYRIKLNNPTLFAL